MIKKGMGDKEILAELARVDKIIISRLGGYLLKYRKGLKSKAYKHNDVLGVQEYDIEGNKCLLCFQKIEYGKVSDVAVANMVITEDGAYIPSYNEWKRLSYIFLSKHSIDRMWQRMGMTLKEFFVNEYCVKAQTAHHLVKYDDYGYDDNTYIMNYGKCFFIAVVDETKIVIKTCLDRDKIYSNQLQMYVDSKRGGEFFADKTYEVNKAIVLSRFKKTNDVYKSLCA